MKKLLAAIFVVLSLIIGSVSTVFADGGQSGLNIPFIVIVCVLAPVLVGIIVYYVVRANKQKKCESKKEVTKIVRDYEDK